MPRSSCSRRSRDLQSADDSEALTQSIKDAYEAEDETWNGKTEVDDGDGGISIPGPGNLADNYGGPFAGLAVIFVAVMAVVGWVTDNIPGLK